MADTGNILRKTVPLFFLALSGLALLNVYSDNAEVVEMAETIACGKKGCAVQKIEEHRNALSQRFVFQTSVQPLKTQQVTCTRSLIFFGSYSCESR